MKVYLSGHYSNDFMGGVIKAYESLSREHIADCGGGVLPDIMRAVTEGRSPRKINEGAMKIYLAGGMIGNLREYWRIFAEIGDYGKAIAEFLKTKENKSLPLRGHGCDLHGREIPMALPPTVDGGGRVDDGGGAVVDGESDR